MKSIDCAFYSFWGRRAPVYNMKKDKRIIEAEEILNVLEENPKHVSNLVSNLIGGFITILVGLVVLREIKKQL